jgi:hypothetical protein
MLLADLAISFPEIAQALRGQEGDGNGRKEVPAFQLSLKIRDGAFKWSLYSDESAWMFFGTVKDVKNPLEAIERDLAAGTCDKVLTKSRESRSNRR